MSGGMILDLGLVFPGPFDEVELIETGVCDTGSFVCLRDDLRTKGK